MTYQLVKELLIESMKAEFPTYEFRFSQQEDPERTEYLLCNIPSVDYSPALNVNKLYQSVLDNGYTSLPAIIDTCKKVFKDCFSNTDYESLTDFNQVKDRIYCRLIDGRRNSKMLAQAFHMPYLDLQVVFYITTENEMEHIRCECILHSGILDYWNLSAEELLAIAKRNLLRIAAPTILSLNELELLTGVPLEIEAEESSHFVFCKNINHGSTMLLFPEFFELFSKKLGSDLYLVPISDNELAIEKNTRAISAIKSARDNISIPDNERLGEHIYSYHQGSLQIGIVLDSGFHC